MEMKIGIRKNKKAFSAVIASLILMLLAVAAGVVVYAYVMGWIGSAQQNPTSTGKMQIDSITASTTTITAYVRNVGGVDLVLNRTYVNGNFVANGTDITATTGNLPVQATGKLLLTYTMEKNKFYDVSIVCIDGTTLATSVQAK
jgi:FlaG/FlaF family flagellin (archaellin)